MDEQKWLQSLKHMKLVLHGGISFYEDEASDIMRLLSQQQKGYLANGLSMLGASLYWMLEIVEETSRPLEEPDK